MLKRDLHAAGSEEVWKGLDWLQALGLGFEQVLKCLAATESVEGAFGAGFVVFSNVRSRNASPDGVAGVPIGLLEQRALKHLASELWRELDWLGLRVVDVDVPFGSGHSHDIVGILKPGGLLPFSGLTSMEIYMTTGSFESERVAQKKTKAGANIATAAVAFCLHLLVVIRVAVDSDYGLIGIGKRYYRWDGNDWIQVLYHFSAPHRVVVGDQERALQALLDKLGNPFQSKTKHTPFVFKMRDVFKHTRPKLHTDQASKALIKKGVKGIKKRSLSIGSGGDRTDHDSVWTAPLSAVLSAFPYLWRQDM